MRFFTIFGLELLFVAFVKANTAANCYSNGYQNCLDYSGYCTNDASQCSQSCNYNSDCSENCCVNGYCTYSYDCSSSSAVDTIQTSIQIIFIIIPVVFGTCCLITIVSCCIRRRMALKRIAEEKIEAQGAASITQAINNQMLIQNMQYIQSMNENQQFINGRFGGPNNFIGNGAQMQVIQMTPSDAFLAGAPMEQVAQVGTSDKKNVYYQPNITFI